jgi:hypothetical protein
MIRTIHILCLTLVVVMLSSCFKKDQQVPAHLPGNEVTDTIALTSDYKYQVYYDLGTGTSVSSNLKTASDIGFECSASGWKIILNTADFMMAADLGAVPFGQAQDTLHALWRFDKSSGNPDSLAIGKWFTVSGNDTLSLHHVYAINRGFDENANALGCIQMTIDSLRKGTYYFRFARLNGQNNTAATIAKDSVYNYIWYSFSLGGAVKMLEPLKTGYDLLFTQYTTLLFTSLGEAQSYLVTGVLLNHSHVQAVLDSIHPFESITMEIARNLPYTNDLDAIGYTWKALTGGYTYTIKLNYSYVIKDTEGYFYKLRFNSFYLNGVKGYPVIEFQAL